MMLRKPPVCFVRGALYTAHLLRTPRCSRRRRNPLQNQSGETEKNKSGGASHNPADGGTNAVVLDRPVDQIKPILPFV